MEKVRQWCDQPSDRGRLRNRTEMGAGAVAKYCDEYVCLSVRQDISATTQAIFTNFSVRVAYGRGSVLLRPGDEIPRGRDILGVFLIDNALQCVRCKREDHSFANNVMQQKG